MAEGEPPASGEPPAKWGEEPEPKPQDFRVVPAGTFIEWRLTDLEFHQVERGFEIPVWASIGSFLLSASIACAISWFTGDLDPERDGILAGLTIGLLVVGLTFIGIAVTKGISRRSVIKSVKARHKSP